MQHLKSVSMRTAIALLAFGAAMPSSAGGCSMDARDVYAENASSVVQVFSLSINPFLVRDRVAPRFGTGFLLEDGYLATNYHVVADAQQTTVFFGEYGLPAQVIGIDPTLDVAVLWTVQPADALEFADSDQLEIGQEAFVIGFPLGLGKTITSGVVSGVSRILPTTTSSWLSPYIQTDAAISPGNSGGPLMDDCGRVIGMITSGISENGAENIGFAIPSTVLRPIVEELIDDGHVARPWHGIYGQMTTPQVMQVMGWSYEDWFGDASGFLVETIEPGSAADRAGLRGGEWPFIWGGTEILVGGDIITHVNGTRINTLDAALGAVGALEIGEAVELTINREGVVLKKSVVIEERPMLDAEMEVYRQQQ